MVCLKLKDGSKVICDDNQACRFTKDGKFETTDYNFITKKLINKNKTPDFYHDFLVTRFSDIEKVYNEFDDWKPKTHFKNTDFINLVEKLFWFRGDDLLYQFSIYLKRMIDLPSFNINCNDEDKIISVFFKPADIVFRWSFNKETVILNKFRIKKNNDYGRVYCSKEIDLDQFEMLMCILKKEIVGL